MKIAKFAMWASLFGMTAALPSRAATEAEFTANTTGDLADLCAAQPDAGLGSAALGFCYGFAQGAVSVEMQRDAGSRSAKLFCLPNPLPGRSETMTAFVAWAHAAPDRLGRLPTDGLLGFLAERFPCANGK